MIARTVFVLFCAIIQTAFCQDDNDTIINIEELIAETRYEMFGYAANIQNDYGTFDIETRSGIDHVNSVRNSIKYQLVELASTLNQNNYNISDCLILALKNISNTVYETRKKLELNQFTVSRALENSEFGPLDREINTLLEELLLSNSDCMTLGNVSKVNLCISELTTEINNEMESIRTRMDEAEPQILAELQEFIEIQRQDLDEFEVSIQNTTQATEQELTACINTL